MGGGGGGTLGRGGLSVRFLGGGGACRVGVVAGDVEPVMA